MKGWLCILLLGLLLGTSSFAAAPASVEPAAKPSLNSPTRSNEVPVPQTSEKALRFYRQSNFVWCLRNLGELALPALFLFAGFSGRLRDFAQRHGRVWYFTFLIYLSVFLLLGFLVSFPLKYFWGFVKFHEFGLSNQTFGKWFTDHLKALLVTFVTGAAFLWVPYWLLKKFPQRWWIITAFAIIPFLFCMALVKPLFIDPLFNDFGPMKNQTLGNRILRLAEQAGIHGSRVYEVNKSIDTKTVNAYVTGFLGTKRIVLWDTLLAKLNDEEVLYVMGHEMGHYALNHVAKGILFSSVLVLVALYGIQRTARALIARYQSRWRFEQLHDIASFPLLLLLIHVFSFVLTPIGFAFGRHLEHEADRFGLELTRDNRAAATGFVKLVHENLSNPHPGPIYKFFRATHPPLGERIDFMNHYRPWEAGQPLKYGAYFHAQNQP